MITPVNLAEYSEHTCACNQRGCSCQNPVGHSGEVCWQCAEQDDHLFEDDDAEYPMDDVD